MISLFYFRLLIERLQFQFLQSVLRLKLSFYLICNMLMPYFSVLYCLQTIKAFVSYNKWIFCIIYGYSCESILLVEIKTVKIQSLRIRFLRNSESVSFVYDGGGCNFLFLEGNIGVWYGFILLQISAEFPCLKENCLLIEHFILKFIDFLAKFSNLWKL